MASKQLSYFVFFTFFMYGVFANGVNAGTAVAVKSQIEVIFETSKGSFTLKLDPVKAPETVVNFLAYVDEGFYDDTIFHRVIPDFVIQGGGFKSGMNYKTPRSPVKNESANRLKNIRGTISMARKNHPDTATSQFYINLKHNTSLDYKSDVQPGYTVFGSISQGMDVIDKISVVSTATVERFRDVPKDDVMLISVKRKGLAASTKNDTSPDISGPVYIEGEHYVVLDKPVATRNSSKVEVVEMFSYGCPHCYEFEPLVKDWSKQQGSDVDFWYFPAVWNKPMKLYARAFYTAQELNVSDETHMPLFTAIVIQNKSIRDEIDLANFFENYGVDKKVFRDTFNSPKIIGLAGKAEERVRNYKPVGVPEIVINGKYRIGRMHAGGMAEMLAVADYLIEKERALLSK